MDYPFVLITDDWLSKAKELLPQVRVYRTQASDIDTLVGILGEFAFAAWYYGDWRKNRVGENKGEVNFKDIEIKTSAFPFSDRLNLLVREDYAKKRKPPYYIQCIIDIDSRRGNTILSGTKVYICGFASSDEVDSAPLRDFGSKYGRPGGYLCHYIPINSLHPINELKG